MGWQRGPPFVMHGEYQSLTTQPGSRHFHPGLGARPSETDNTGNGRGGGWREVWLSLAQPQNILPWPLISGSTAEARGGKHHTFLSKVSNESDDME